MACNPEGENHVCLHYLLCLVASLPNIALPTPVPSHPTHVPAHGPCLKLGGGRGVTLPLPLLSSCNTNPHPLTHTTKPKEWDDVDDPHADV